MDIPHKEEIITYGTFQNNLRSISIVCNVLSTGLALSKEMQNYFVFDSKKPTKGLTLRSSAAN